MLNFAIIFVSVFSVLVLPLNGNFLDSGPHLKQTSVKAASEFIENVNAAMDNEISTIFSDSQNEMQNLDTVLAVPLWMTLK